MKSVLPALLLLTAPLPGLADEVLSNDSYKVTLLPNGAIEIATDGVAQTFGPDFTILSRDRDPKLALKQVNIPKLVYNVPTWLTDGPSDQFARRNEKVQRGDGVDVEKPVAEQEKRTGDVFRSGDARNARATSASVSDGRIHWHFATPELEASIELPPGKREPELTYRFTPAKAGWYSVGYTGAPRENPEKVSEIWQPLIWTEKRFPTLPYLTLGGMCPLPATLATANGITVGLVADPSELPFQPLPRWQNSTFGVAVRNHENQVQPMLFAPAMGGPGSQRNAGETFSFKLRLVVHRGTTNATFEYIARTIYEFSDIRQNQAVSLNKTLENMIDYGLSDYSRFDHELRGCMYETDVPGAVKNVSSLHPLAIAFVTDNQAIYTERARPIMEFLLSREKTLFVLDPEMKIQHPSRFLKGPCAPVSELTALYELSQKRTPLFLDYALEKAKTTDDWIKLLALYRATGDQALLTKATAEADLYLQERIEKKQHEFTPRMQRDGFFFWTEFAPYWIPLLELYEETGEKRFLEASHQGAREFTQFIYYCPRIPAEDVQVNDGGKAPLYWYLASKGHSQMQVAEESVPAWRLSEIGLTPESAGTAAGHRGILLATHAPWMLRIAEHTGDRFLHDTARAAVIGRYENFPGYHINTARSTIYQKADYPLRAHKELSYNSFHYNHIWPQIVMLLDYLVSDIFHRSRGAIHFPSRYAEGYAYLQNKIYGDRPGEIYGEKDVHLWMPKGLFTIDHPEVNYIAGRKQNTLYAVLTNQSKSQVSARLKLNDRLVRFDRNQPLQVRVWEENEQSAPSTVEHGELQVSVAPNGITAVAIEEAEPQVQFQHKLFAEGPGMRGSHVVPLDCGNGRGMLISFGPQVTHAYVYLQDTEDNVKEAKLHYRDGEAWKTVADAKYPYEFTIEWNRPEPFQFSVEALSPDGSAQKSKIVSLPAE